MLASVMLVLSSQLCPSRLRVGRKGVVDGGGGVLPGTHPSSDPKFQPHNEEGRAPSSLLLSWNEAQVVAS